MSGRICGSNASVAELADAAGREPAARKGLGVRVSSFAPSFVTCGRGGTADTIGSEPIG